MKNLLLILLIAPLYLFSQVGINDNNLIVYEDSTVLNGRFIRFNSSEGVFEFEMAGGTVVWQGALEDLVQVWNNTGAEIANGTPLYFSGSIGDTMATVGIASANNANALNFVGLATETIANNDWGYMATRGKVRALNTVALSVIGNVYLSNDSSWTNTKPAYPSEVVLIGHLINSDATNGIIYVNPSLGLKRQVESKSYSFTSQGIGSGTFYKAGYYDYPATDANLSQALTNINYGSANATKGAHAFVVCGGAGSADAGIMGLRVTGTSIDDTGARTPSDADTIIADITAVALNQYVEAKKFIGTVNFELITISGSPTTYSLDFNYGFAKYEDFGNRDFYIFGIEVVGLAGANDTGFDVDLMHHKSTGWTYSAAAFVAGDGSLANWATDNGTEKNLVNAEDFAWKRTDINTLINGNDGEGIIIEITTGANNAVQIMDVHTSSALD